MKLTLLSIAIAACLGSACVPALAQDTASITQLGTNGVAAINQAGNLGANQATIVQNSGDGNHATINQTALGTDPGAPPGGSTATITQAGNMNAATIDQHGSNRSSATVSQDGDRNQVGISQVATDQGLVDSTQRGSDNSALIKETGVVNDAGIFAAGVRLQQLGNGNDARIVKHDSNALATFVTQSGDMNTARIDQTGFNGEAETLQVGNRNTLQLRQDSGGFVNAGIMQLGDGNMAHADQARVSSAFLSVQQTGNGNGANVNQHDGNGLPAFVFQNGNYNAANVDESGTNGSVFVSQQGDYNVANVVQNSVAPGGSTVLVTQNSNANVANVNQVGAGLSATIHQAGGDGNVATINQHF